MRNNNDFHNNGLQAAPSGIPASTSSQGFSNGQQSLSGATPGVSGSSARSITSLQAQPTQQLSRPVSDTATTADVGAATSPSSQTAGEVIEFEINGVKFLTTDRNIAANQNLLAGKLSDTWIWDPGTKSWLRGDAMDSTRTSAYYGRPGTTGGIVFYPAEKKLGLTFSRGGEAFVASPPPQRSQGGTQLASLGDSTSSTDKSSKSAVNWADPLARRSFDLAIPALPMMKQ